MGERSSSNQISWGIHIPFISPKLMMKLISFHPFSFAQENLFDDLRVCRTAGFRYLRKVLEDIARHTPAPIANGVGCHVQSLSRVVSRAIVPDQEQFDVIHVISLSISVLGILTALRLPKCMALISFRLIIFRTVCVDTRKISANS